MKVVQRADGFWHRRLDVGAVQLHVAEGRPAGCADDEVPTDVPLVVFLHGYPELWLSWQHQLRAFAAAGLWAVAPDLRGYNESDKPEGVAAYAIERLSADVAGLVRALGRKTALIVGHDWGGAIAWAVAEKHPSVVAKLAILNAPHPVKLGRALRTLRQLRKSWYMFFFQLPRVPELVVAWSDFAFIRKLLRDDGIPGDEIEPYVAAAKVPGALTAMINYYRAAIRGAAKSEQHAVIACPVLVVWGDADRYLGIELAEPPQRLVPNARIVHLPGVSHWVQNAAPEKVNELLLEFARS